MSLVIDAMGVTSFGLALEDHFAVVAVDDQRGGGFHSRPDR